VELLRRVEERGRDEAGGRACDGDGGRKNERLSNDPRAGLLAEGPRSVSQLSAGVNGDGGVNRTIGLALATSRNASQPGIVSSLSDCSQRTGERND
jgi:hypothetical protein